MASFYNMPPPAAVAANTVPPPFPTNRNNAAVAASRGAEPPLKQPRGAPPRARGDATPTASNRPPQAETNEADEDTDPDMPKIFDSDTDPDMPSWLTVYQTRKKRNARKKNLVECPKKKGETGKGSTPLTSN